MSILTIHNNMFVHNNMVFGDKSTTHHKLCSSCDCTLCLMHYADIRILNRIATRAVNSGMIIVGGGLIKHHICNANLMVSRWGRGKEGVGRRQSEEV